MNMEKTYCIFGDSVAQAAYVQVGWVELLSQYLEEKYQGDFVNVFNLGIGGNTTKDVLERFEAESSARKPTNIIIAVGINDTKFYTSKDFKVNLEKLIGLAKKVTSEITLVGLVLGNWKGDEPFSNKKTTDFNNVIKEVAASKGYKFIPLQEVLKPEDYMDGLHPNNQGHSKMFEVIKKFY